MDAILLNRLFLINKAHSRKFYKEWMEFINFIIVWGTVKPVLSRHSKNINGKW